MQRAVSPIADPTRLTDNATFCDNIKTTRLWMAASYLLPTKSQLERCD